MMLGEAGSPEKAGETRGELEKAEECLVLALSRLTNGDKEVCVCVGVWVCVCSLYFSCFSS